MSLTHENNLDNFDEINNVLGIRKNNNKKNDIESFNARLLALVISNHYVDYLTLRTKIVYKPDPNQKRTALYLQKKSINTSSIKNKMISIKHAGEKDWNVRELVTPNDGNNKLYQKLGLLLNKDKVVYNDDNPDQILVVTPWTVVLDYPNNVIESYWNRNILAVMCQFILPQTLHQQCLVYINNMEKVPWFNEDIEKRVLAIASEFVNREDFRKEWIKNNFSGSYKNDYPAKENKNFDFEFVDNEGGDGILNDYSDFSKPTRLTHKEYLSFRDYIKKKNEKFVEKIVLLKDHMKEEYRSEYSRLLKILFDMLKNIRKDVEDCQINVEKMEVNNDLRNELKIDLQLTLNRINEMLIDMNVGNIGIYNNNLLDPDRMIQPAKNWRNLPRNSNIDYTISRMFKYGNTTDLCVDLNTPTINLEFNKIIKLSRDTGYESGFNRRDRVTIDDVEYIIEDYHNIILYKTGFDETTYFKMLAKEKTMKKVVQELEEDLHNNDDDNMIVEEDEQFKEYDIVQKEKVLFEEVYKASTIMTQPVESKHYHGNRMLIRLLYPTLGLDRVIRNINKYREMKDQILEDKYNLKNH